MVWQQRQTADQFIPAFRILVTIDDVEKADAD
jgi:hypothetical protein